jgi:K+-transporting ATPase ATPase A chain
MRWLQYAAFLIVVLWLAKPVGLYLARVCERGATFLDPVLLPVERALYRMLGVQPEQEMTPRVYIACFLLFGLCGMLAMFSLLIFERSLPGGPADRYLTTPMTWDLALNTAVSFATTTTWQAYGGETTLHYAVQLLALVAQNFLAAAGGLAVGFAFIRGFARERSETIGNFWVDMVRSLLWVLLPIAVIGSLFLVWQGVPLNFDVYALAHSLEGRTQTIPQGPVAALEFIKNLGTNGGGFFNANGSHPYANPTPLTSFVALLAIAVLPASLMMTFGHLARKPSAGWILLKVMAALFVLGLIVCDHAEMSNMEGKEARFGVGDSVLTAIVTANGATGSNNSMYDSYRPQSVMTLLVYLMLGEVVFGGLGTGVCSMVIVALVGVFLGGLMVGRTPEYLGKKVTSGETRWVALYALLTPKTVLLLTALAVALPAGRAGLVTNHGARGFTEILFAYASSMANNGMALAGLNSNTAFYNLTTAAAMLAGRFGLSALALTLAGRFAAQSRLTTTAGTFPDDTPMFGTLVFGAIVIVGALSFLPALALGPILESFQHGT